MKLHKLGDIFQITSGGTPNRRKSEFYIDGTIPWIKTGDLKAKYVPHTLELITPLGLKSSSAKLFPSKTVLIAMYGASIGNCSILDFEASTNQACAAFLPNEKVDEEYLYYFLKSIKHQLTSLGQGGGQPNISATLLKSVKIPLPEDFNDQIRIATLLSRVESLITTRKENLRQLDELLKSTFLEMFGDIRAKKSKHTWEKPRPYLKANSGKSSKKVISDSRTEFPIYGGNGINGWATEPLYTEKVIVAGRVGQQCGIIHVTNGPSWVTDNAIVLKIIDKTKLDVTYLANAFQYAPIREKVKQLDLPFINQSMLLDFPIPVPSLNLQKSYAAIVEKVEKIKKKNGFRV